MKLARYREKRDPARTNEPFGKDPAETPENTRAGPFVIHLHEAGRTHHDLRLAMGGVLVSFAVPKGPSLDPSEKRFAIRTEDHPIEYLDFEAVIPEGNYGAGSMIVWDLGRARYLEGTAEEGLEKGKIDLELQGHKLRGRFALVRTKSDKEWLFFKKPDAHARPGGDIAAEAPRSVLSGLTVGELAEMPRITREIEAEAAALGAEKRVLDYRSLVPMLCAATGAPTAGEGWLYEIKLDGVRALLAKDGREAAIRGRSLRDFTATYPEVARAVGALPATRAVLDGEIVTFDEAGQPSFQKLTRRIHLVRDHEIRLAMAEVPVVCVLFDLLAIGEYDLTRAPLIERKKLLRRLLPAPGVLRVLDHLEGDGRPLIAFCRDRGLEGVVAKRAGSPYRPGPTRSPDWVKMKCERDAEFVVVGFTRGEGARDRLGALDIATWDGDALVYRGKVGSGIDEETVDALLGMLTPLAVGAPSAKGAYASAPRGRTHVRPEVVVSVRFFGWSEGGLVWHPTFRGVRADVDPKQCRAAPSRKAEEDEAPRGKAKAERPAEKALTDARLTMTGAAAATGAAARAAAATAEVTAAMTATATVAASVATARAEAAAAPRVAVTNKDKVLFPADGITKGEVCAYYKAIAPFMLPYLRDRPIVMVRYPDGIKGKSFYQWNVPPGTPKWIRTCRVPSEEGSGTVEVFILDNEDALLYVANLAAIPIHILAARAASPEACDFLTIDFDLKKAPFASAVALAQDLRGLLSAIGLTGYPKTSGQSGLHVLVPLGPGIAYAAARTLTDLLGHLLVARNPAIATMERLIARRGTRVYVDTGQTGPARTIVAPFSVRATDGATVSTPLSWDEVRPSLNPSSLSIRSVVARAQAEGDPMAPMLSARPDIGAAVQKLEALMQPRR
jgi:bifunctional non-homologous end joining protein LigD